MRAVAIAFATVLIGSGDAQQTTPDPNPIFKSSAREVLLEVAIRDPRGRLVAKVDPSQVTVYEDGVPQTIRSFRLVQGREVREQDAKQIAQTAVTQAASTNGSRAPFNPLRTVNLVCLILNDLGPDTRAFAFDAARKFVNNELRPDTFIGVFSLDASGLRPVFPFSNNREHLLKAVELASVNQLPTLTQSTAAMLNGLSMSTIGVSVNNNGTADGSSAQDPLGTRGDMGLAVNAGLREIDALIRLVKQLSSFPFQKTVLLMSTGLTRPPDQIEYWQSLITAANKSGVTFYGLDVYGLGVCQNSSGDCATASGNTAASTAFLQKAADLSRQQIRRGGPNQGGGATTGPPAAGQDVSGGPSSAAQMMDLMHQTDYLRFGVLSANKQEALRELSESTGGFIIANTNNTEKLLARVMEDVDTHYELAYRPASTINDGHFRKIEVKLTQANLRVQTRSGYFAVPETGENPLTPGDFAGLRALDTKPLPHAFGFGSKAFRFRSDKSTSQYAIAFEVPISNLTATAEATAQKHRFHASLLALVKNEEGEIVERLSKDVTSDVPDRSLQMLRADTMTYEHPVNIGLGRYSIETAVVDQEGNRTSTNILQIDNGEHQDPVLSDLVLIHRVHNLTRPPDPLDPFEIPGKRVQPFVVTTLPTGVKPSVYFVVYPGKETGDVPSLRVEFLKDGRTLATKNYLLPKPDSSGAIPMAIEAVAAPGDYEVRITIGQGRGSVQRSLHYTIGDRN